MRAPAALNCYLGLACFYPQMPSFALNLCSNTLLLNFLLLLFSHSVVSDSLWPHGLQHTRLPCPSLSPALCSNSCLLNWWCHPTISSSHAPFSFCPQSFPAPGSFILSWLFASGGPKYWSFSISPMIQSWFSLGLAGLICLLSKGLSRVFSSTTVWKHQFFSAQPSLWSNPHPHMTTGKTIALIRWTFVCKVVSLLLNTLSRFFIAFLPRSKHLLVSWSSHHLEWFFWPCQVACGILVPGPGIQSMPPALEAWSPNHCATREGPFITFLGQTLYSKRPAEIKNLLYIKQQPSLYSLSSCPALFFMELLLPNPLCVCWYACWVYPCLLECKLRK